MTGTNRDNLLRWFGLYEKTSASTGNQYFVGAIGGLKILILQDKYAESGQPTWNVFVAERAAKAGAADSSHSKAVRRPAGKRTEPSLPLATGLDNARPSADADFPFDDPIPEMS